MRAAMAETRLKIPAGTQNGQRFRLKQRGLTQPGGGRGDLYVQVKVSTPSPRKNLPPRPFGSLSFFFIFGPPLATVST